ncbi:MAG: glycosyltransferase family 2 protein, partial [Candidatus Obscuribacterales bacterium]|nr:glycosyltransferase family 2 protein [Candidatus Obscuribacterales bacterium]
MLLVSIFLVLITIVAAVVQTISFSRLCEYVETELNRKRPSFQPRASVILPCKGLDPDFKDNITRLLNQDYPDFEVIFSVADRSDPAYESLVELSKNAGGRAQIVVAGIDPRRAQKLNNQLCALKKACPRSEVLVFVDSDVIAGDDFLTNLIEPLADNTIGVTTGYRFYLSSPGNLPSILRSLWNRMSAWEMASNHAFAWGGAMAISRNVFEKAAVAQSWDRSCDDDLSLTTCIKAIGLSVHFVPRCLVASKGDASFSEIIEWTNRQLILTK